MKSDAVTSAAARSAGRAAAGFIRSIAGRGKRLLFPYRDYRVWHGSVLPAPELRFNGPDQQDDAFYLASSMREADRVISKLGCEPSSVLVDIGCGQGRLPIGLVLRLAQLRYLGLDVSHRSIDWCQRHIQSRHPTYAFQHIDLVNARYNPQGRALPPDFRLPVPDGGADVVYLWGVVTNMEPEHLPVYTREIARMLRPGGRLFLTANVEDGVPPVSINPENYTRFACRGPLHIVRYDRRYFLDTFAQCGLAMTDYAHHAAGNCQSDLYFIRRA